jgi:hypothetical protein
MQTIRELSSDKAKLAIWIGIVRRGRAVLLTVDNVERSDLVKQWAAGFACDCAKPNLITYVNAWTV